MYFKQGLIFCSILVLITIVFLLAFYKAYCTELIRCFIIVFYYFNNGQYDLIKLFKNENIPIWLLSLGIFSQVLFTFRFVYQWLYSEKTKVSELPIGFWRISVLGALLILTYAIIRLDPVLFIGHIAGLVIYIRNILIWKTQKTNVV